MEIKNTCCYGHKCENISSEGGSPVLERCVKYIQVATTDDKGDDKSEFKCSDVWMVDIAIMNNKISGHIVHAVDEVRVQQTKRQDVALQIAGGKFLENDIMKSLNEEIIDSH